MDKVKKFSKTDNGKRVIKDKIKSYVETGGNSIVPSKSNMLYEAEKLKRSILGVVQDLVASGELPECIYQIVNEMNIGAPLEHNGFGASDDFVYKIDMWFNEDMINRQSLMHVDNRDVRTGSGINNIVALFNNGVDTDKTVFGIWENHLGEEIFVSQSKNKRPALRFMQDGVYAYRKYLIGEYGGMNIYVFLNTAKYDAQ